MQSPPSSFPAALPDSPGGQAPAKVKSLLPFDVLRVGIAMVTGWKSVLAATILGGAAAGGAAWVVARSKYIVEVQLVRREAPNTFQASQIGQAFRPRELSSATVMSLMVSSTVLDRTGAAMDPPVDRIQLQKRIEIEPEKNIELISVAYTSPDSPQRAASDVNLYAGNVLKLLEEMQIQEAKELLKDLDAQLARTDTQLNQARADLQTFARESGLTDPEREIDNLMRQIADLDLKIETAGINRQGTAFSIQQIRDELRRLDPTMLKLAEERQRLDTLMRTFTKNNPEVIEQEKRISDLAQQAKARSGKTAEQENFDLSGNTLANSLYLDLIRLRREQDNAITEEEKLQAFREGLKQRLAVLPDKILQNTKWRSQVTSLETTRDLLAGRRREAQLYADKAPGYYRLFAEANANNILKAGRARKIIILGIAGGMLCGGLALALRALRAMRDDALVSPSDLRRALGVPVAAMLPPKETMSSADLDRWRFTTWAELVKTIHPPPDGALMAGLISAGDGEGKTTWLQHMSQAALERGLKVLTVYCHPPGTKTDHGLSGGKDAALTANGTDPPSVHRPVFSLEEVLENPEQHLRTLRVSSPPVLRLQPMEGFVWTADWLTLWRDALGIWSREPALAVLVELPPASRMDSLLLAESMPALFWLSGSGQTHHRQVDPVLETVRRSGLPLSASLLNRVPPVFLKLPDLAKYGLCVAAGLLLLTGGQAPAQAVPGPGAQEAVPPTPADTLIPAAPPAGGPPVPALEATLPPTGTETPPGLDSLPEDSRQLPPADTPPAAPVPGAIPPSVRRPLPPAPQPANPALAGWQRNLTLGPGDTVNFQVYGAKQYTRTDVPIAPDGTLTYLQVYGFKASGLTIDQLREGMTKALAAHVPNARVIVTPGAWRSKKYYMLGTVMERGVFTLDRPTTLMEAAARARGMETGVVNDNTVEIADLKRAFLIRQGRKLPINFSKLFYEGDMSQNIALEPGDYIYFPSNTVNEVYVLGSVGEPGSLGISQNLTVVGAIAQRGGFARSAWRKRVLIVRGQLEKPTVMVVDTAAILSGKQRDVPLEPLDLVYVTDKPWKYAAEILDLAMKSFVQSVASSWASSNVQPFLGDTSSSNSP